MSLNQQLKNHDKIHNKMHADKFQNKYRIDSARLKNYDYSSCGAYFLTIVTKSRECFFGEILDEAMVLNEIGEISQKYWDEIPQYFPFIKLDKMVVMPNHVHGILWIDSAERTVVEPYKQETGGVTKSHNPMFYNNISRVLRWYKGRCTFEINKIYGKTFFAWQPRFHDRIIRDDEELNRIRQYIIANPQMWERDRNNKIG